MGGDSRETLTLGLMRGKIDQMSLEDRENLLGLMLLVPSVIFFFVLIGWPLVQSIWLGFTATHTLTREGGFIGLGNYIELFSGYEFWRSLLNNIIWMVGAVTGQLFVGVSVALMLHQNLVFRSLARGLVLFPYLLPMVVAVLTWQWVFNDLYGIINHFLVSSGIVRVPIDWFGRMPNAMISVIILGTWKFFPFVVIAVLARLQTIPEQLYEAAKMDGASAWGRFWDVTLPQLKEVLVIVILLRAIWDFKDFDLIWLLTGGGPVISTQTLPLLVYKQAFPLLHMGKAAAVSVAMLAFMLLLFLLYFRTYGRAEEEDR